MCDRLTSVLICNEHWEIYIVGYVACQVPLFCVNLWHEIGAVWDFYNMYSMSVKVN